LNLVQPYLADLRLRSTTRLATNQDFVYIRQDIDEYLKRQSDKTASLNERERLEERRQADARQKSREAERAARKAPDVKIYELSVKQAAESGLPPAQGETNLVAAARPAAEADPAAGGDEKVDAPPPPKSPAVDPVLDEAKRILADYISLLSASQVLIAH
jgi:hypothetical protein